MDILQLLDQSDWIERYEIQDFRQWNGGLYYKLKIVFHDQSILFAREYMDESERNYSFHWQDQNDALIMRWDNAPHHDKITTFPHHKHDKKGSVTENIEITIKKVLKIIQAKLFKTGLKW